MINSAYTAQEKEREKLHTVENIQRKENTKGRQTSTERRLNHHIYFLLYIICEIVYKHAPE